MPIAMKAQPKPRPPASRAGLSSFDSRFLAAGGSLDQTLRIESAGTCFTFKPNPHRDARPPLPFDIVSLNIRPLRYLRTAVAGGETVTRCNLRTHPSARRFKSRRSEFPRIAEFARISG